VSVPKPSSRPSRRRSMTTEGKGCADGGTSDVMKVCRRFGPSK